MDSLIEVSNSDIYNMNICPTIKSKYFNLPYIDNKISITRKDFTYIFPEDTSNQLEIQITHHKIMKFLMAIKNIDTMLEARRRASQTNLDVINPGIYDQTDSLKWKSDDDLNNIIKGERRFVDMTAPTGFFKGKNGLFGIYIGESK